MDLKGTISFLSSFLEKGLLISVFTLEHKAWHAVFTSKKTSDQMTTNAGMDVGKRKCLKYCLWKWKSVQPLYELGGAS